MMEKKFSWILVGALIILSMVLVSCGATEPSTTPPGTTPPTTSPVGTTVVSSPTTTTVASGNWWDALGNPKHGGTINLRLKKDPVAFDPYWSATEPSIWLENLGHVDWTTPPELCNFSTNYIPSEARAGQLVESWEQPDLQTVIFHVRQGVYWQDKPPVNGREFTAYDVEYSYHRTFGLGSGFTEPSPYRPNSTFKDLESVTATDKYTVVFKWKVPSVTLLDTLLDYDSGNAIICKEVIEQFGDMRNWENAVSTGPWILQDYVVGSSLTFARNPNYWGYDERHPENQLPYADYLKFHIIPDDAAAMTALRPGKIDLLEDLNWEQAQSLLKTNPELVSSVRPINGLSLDLRCDTPPFNDIRVRKALQMAIDLPTIAKTYYGGNADPTPRGLVGEALFGYYVPFDEWPAELQAEYTYNPDEAKRLLAEAGYPNGFDTNCVASASYDIEFLKILKSYLAKVGINMEIKVMDHTSFTSFSTSNKHDAIVAQDVTSGGLNNPIDRILTRRYSNHQSNRTMNNDKVYDDIVDRFNASLDPVERQQLMVEADMYSITQHWSVNTFTLNKLCLYSPSLKGFDAQKLNHGRGFYYARYWKE